MVTHWVFSSQPLCLTNFLPVPDLIAIIPAAAYIFAFGWLQGGEWMRRGLEREQADCTAALVQRVRDQGWDDDCMGDLQ